MSWRLAGSLWRVRLNNSPLIPGLKKPILVSKIVINSSEPGLLPLAQTKDQLHRARRSRDAAIQLQRCLLLLCALAVLVMFSCAPQQNAEDHSTIQIGFFGDLT